MKTKVRIGLRHECTALDNQPTIDLYSGTVLAWSQTILENYSRLSLISPIQTLDDEVWHNGLGFLCLLHCFFPEEVPDLLNAVREPDFRSFDVFKAHLGVEPPELPLECDKVATYLESIRNAIDARGEELQQQLKMTQAQLKTETYQIRLTRRTREKTVEDEEFERRAILVLNKISHLRTQLNDMTLMATTGSSRHTQEAASNEAPEDDLATRMKVFEEQLDSLNLHDRVELETYVQQMPDNNSAVATRMQAIDAAYSALQLQLQEDFEAIRENILFSELTTPIRDELEYIQAKMLKTATSEESIHDLETRAECAGQMLDDIARKKGHTLLESGKSYCNQYDALRQKHRLICSWVQDVRVWFTEAEKLRHWMEERINRINSEHLPDALDEHIECSHQNIEEWTKRHEALEKQVETFNKEDMTRLRAHVKALTGSERREDKDLSPADTTTIEITFTTLMVLDKLFHLVRQRSYNLQMLNLRSIWEQEHKISADWVEDAERQVSDILERAQWKKDEEKMRNSDDAENYKNAIVQDLLDLEQRVAEFDQGQFTTMINMYQEIDDTSKIELPAYLESRQVAVEEALEELSKRLAFVRQVVEQRLSIQNFVYLADSLKVVGEQLRSELIAAEETAAPDDTDFTARVRSYQENAVDLVTNVSGHLRYPQASHLKDEASTEETNEIARNAVGARTSYLILFAETLDHHLKSYRNILELKQRADQLHDDINALHSWTESKLSALNRTPVDALTAGNIVDLQTLQTVEKETEVLVGHASSARKDRLGMLSNELQLLTTNVKASNATAVNTNVLKESLQKLTHELDTYNQRLAERTIQIDLLKLRHAWNKEHFAAKQASNTAIQDAWNAILSLQWREADISVDRDDQAKELLERMIESRDDVKAHDLETASKAFAAFNDSVAEKLPESQLPRDIIQSQAGLDKLLGILDDIIEYARAVSRQRSAVDQLDEKSQHLLAKGQELTKQIETATASVMLKKQNGKTAEDMRLLVQQFEKDIDNVRQFAGNEISYPSCPKDAWETRLCIADRSTEAFNTNDLVQKHVLEQHERLSSLKDQLFTLSDQHYQAEQIAGTVDQLLNEIRDKDAKVSSLSTDIKSDRPDLLATQLLWTSLTTDIAEIRKRIALYEEDIGKLDPSGIRAKCQTLEQTIQSFGNTAINSSTVTTSLAALENRVSELANLLKEHKQYVEAFELRANWEQIRQEALGTAEDVQSKLRAASDELDMIISKDMEFSDKDKAYIEDLENQLTQQSKPTLSTLSQQLIPSLKKAYQNMQDRYQNLNMSLPTTLEEYQAEVLTLECDIVEKVKMLEEKFKQILVRIDWQKAAEEATERSLEIEEDIERFISNEARWTSKTTAAMSQDDLKARQKQLEDTINSHSEAVSKLLDSKDQLLQSSSMLETLSSKVSEKAEALKTEIDHLEAQSTFAAEVLSQHFALIAYLEEASVLDKKADELHKQITASNVADAIDISQFKEEVDKLCNQPAIHFPIRNDDPRYSLLDKSANDTVSETIAARQAKLKELVVSLEIASKAKQEAKAAVDAYMQEAQSMRDWINAQLEQIHSIAPELSDNKRGVELLRESLAAIKSVRTAVQGYGGAFTSLMSKSEALLEDSNPEVQATQDQVSRLWHELSKKAEDAEKQLESNLHVAEFKQRVDTFDKEFEQLREQLGYADVSTVTDERISGWRKQVQNLKLQHVDALSNQCKSEDDTTEWRRMQQDHTQLTDLLQDLTSQVHKHRLRREYQSRTQSVQAFVEKILSQVEALRSRYLDVTVEEQDHRAKAQEFVDAYNSIKQTVKKESLQLIEEQRSLYRFLQHQGEQLEDAQKHCDGLVDDVQQQLADVGVAAQTVSQWHSLHVNLNNLSRDAATVANALKESTDMSALEVQISTLTSLNERLENLQQSAKKLTAASHGSTEVTVDAFYAHYNEVLGQLEEVKQLAVEKQQEIEKQRALQENLDAIKVIKDSAEQETADIQKYIESLCEPGQGDDAEKQYRKAAAKRHVSDEKYQELLAALNAKADGLDDTAEYKEASKALSALKSSIELEKSTNDYLRRMVGHVKSANNVMLWIQNCRNAMDNLESQMNLAEDRDINAEIADIAKRVQDFDRFIKSFNSMTEALLDIENVNAALKDAVKARAGSIQSSWEYLSKHLDELREIANKMTRGVAIVRQVKAIMTKLGEIRDQLSSIRLPDNDADEPPSSPLPTQHMPLSDLLREPDALAAMKALDNIESESHPQVDAQMQLLDKLLQEYGESNSSFEQQRAEIDAAVTNLFETFKEKRKQIELALAVGKCLSTTDDTEILISALEEAVNKAAPHRASIVGGNFSKTDVQTRYIELDARYKYYEQKIVESVEAAQAAAEEITDGPQKRRVVNHLSQLKDRAEKVDQLAKSRRDELVKVLESAADPQPTVTSRIRKSSLPTRKASQFLREREKSPSKLLSSINNNNTNNPVKPSTSLPRPSPRYLSANQLQNHSSPKVNQLTVPGERSQLRQPSKSASNLKQPSIKVNRAPPPPPPNKYVADPDNDLDMEIGRIVNETPYKVKVKMVPGEVGRYWFGDVNPKLAYCRVLKSKMVMVRVGGGWMELSEFLRDHALLEGDFIPKARATEAPPTIQEGFIETEQRRRARSQNPPAFNAANINASRSAPQNQHQQQQQQQQLLRPTGYMDGDRYIAVDRYGNELEVKMTRAGSRDHSDNKNSATSQRRRRIPRRVPLEHQQQ